MIKRIGLMAASIVLVALMTGCAAQAPDTHDKAQIAYLLQKIEALEQRTERNEFAVVGLNRRVNGLATMVNTPVPPPQRNERQTLTSSSP